MKVRSIKATRPGMAKSATIDSTSKSAEVTRKKIKEAFTPREKVRARLVEKMLSPGRMET